MKANKGILILTSLVTLLPIPVQLLLGREWTATLLMPLLMLACHWFCVYWTLKDPGNKKQSPKPLKLMFWIVPMMSLFMTGIDYALSTGLEFSVFSALCLFMGLMFIALGNYLPKCRQNSTMGIKVFWAYTSEANWNATHRFGGKLWVAGGIGILLAAFLPENWAAGVMLAAILGMCFAPMVYSWRFYCRQKANGEPLIPVPKLFREGKATLVILAVVLVLVGISLFTGDLIYNFSEHSFTIEASYHDDLTVSYADIASLEYLDHNVPGTRVWGYGSPRLLMGTFQNDTLGTYTRYTYGSPDSTIVMTAQGRTYVLSGRDRDETKAIYDFLSAQIG